MKSYKKTVSRKKISIRLKSVVILVTTSLGLMACRPDNPAITGPQRPPKALEERPEARTVKNGATITFDPRVDILFVLDDSGSMSKHLQNLSDNIKMFVDGFALTAKGNATPIDFHIGYTFAHDSNLYKTDGSSTPPICPANTVNREGKKADGRINWLPAGSLRSVIGLNDKGRNFVTAEDDFTNLLKNTLDPRENSADNHPDTALVKPLGTKKKLMEEKKTNQCPWGPEKEDLFTPLLSLLENPALDANNGFRRPGAFFVAIFISDTNDASKLQVEDVLNRIEAAVGPSPRGDGRRNFRVFSVVMKPGNTFKPGKKPGDCTPDPEWTGVDNASAKDYERILGTAIPQHAMASLAFATEDGSTARGNQVLDVCSDNYGQTLAKYGAKIQEDILRDLVFQLGSRYDISKKLTVSIEDKEAAGGWRPLVQGPDKEWDFNSVDVTITIFTKSDEHPGGVDWKKYAGAKIRPSWTPVSETSKYSRPAR